MKSKILALSKNEEFKKLLQQKKRSNKYVTIYFGYLSHKNKKRFNISFVTKKKIGNAVKRNKIKRKLKAIVQKLIKINSAINLNYIYVIFGKEKAYKEYSDTLFEKMKKSFKRLSIV